MIQTEQEFRRRVETCSEIDLYFTIDFFGAFIWRMNHDMADGRIPEEDHPGIDKDIERCSERSCIAVKQCSRFGVALPVDGENRPTDEYWKWYRWWDDWKHGMTVDEWDIVNAAHSRGMTNSELKTHRPHGDWRSNTVVTK